MTDTLFGVCTLAAGETGQVGASPSRPITLEVLGGHVDTDTHGELYAGETLELTAAITITAMADSTIDLVDIDDDEED